MKRSILAKGIDRRGTSSSKWEKYAGRDVLPFWVADMDLPTAPFVVEAVQARLEHPVLGYTATPEEAIEAFVGWVEWHCGWQVHPDWLVWLPGVVPGFNIAARAFGGSKVVVPTPVYPPFLRVAVNAGLEERRSPLVRQDGRWEMDFDHLAAALDDTSALMFCNPHNPTGRIYERDQLERVAEAILSSGALLVSDEIHCGILLDKDRRHFSVAGFDPELAQRSITLHAPTKAYNMPGLGVAVAVIPDPELKARFEWTMQGVVASVSPLAYAAATAAWNDRSDWLATVNAFLATNARTVEDTVRRFDGLAVTPVEATCLAWIDATQLGHDSPATWLEHHGLGLSPGEDFGAPGFARFNFGCGEAMLAEGLRRLQKAVQSQTG